MDKQYICIDLKSFFASVECMERGLDPLTTNLVVADKSRTEKTICLAVTPSLKAYGIPGRARLFEVVQKVKYVNAERMKKAPGRKFIEKSSNAVELNSNPSLELDYIIAPPQMAKYIEYSTRIQRALFCKSEKELTKQEYDRLLKAAREKNNERLNLIMQTICSTGIRVSELSYVTVSAVEQGQTQVKLKGKIRVVIFTKELCRILKKYIKEQGITSGTVFVTRSGKPIDRHTIWKSMKKLCESANVAPEKVFPHNLRHLFARTFYGLQKDIVRLADILGHSNVNTTRVYTIENGEIHRQQMHKLGLVRMNV